MESRGCHMINRHSKVQFQSVKLVSFVKYRTFTSNFNLYSISNTRLANQTESISNTTSFPYMVIFRSYSQGSTHKNQSPWQQPNKTTVTYMIAIAIVVVGLSYAAVPLYRIFCQVCIYKFSVIRITESLRPILNFAYPESQPHPTRNGRTCIYTGGCLDKVSLIKFIALSCDIMHQYIQHLYISLSQEPLVINTCIRIIINYNIFHNYNRLSLTPSRLIISGSN